MTEIGITNRCMDGVVYCCAVDNHNHKRGKTFSVIYKSINPRKVKDFMIEKGIDER